MTNIELDMEYISLYARQMNASATKAENDKVIFVDELLMYMTLSYFLTVFSHAYDHREQNTKRCMNSFLDLLQIQGKERTTGVRNLQDVWNDHASSKCAESGNGLLLVRMNLYVGYEI